MHHIRAIKARCLDRVDTVDLASVTIPELNDLANRLSLNHGGVVTTAACLWHLTLPLLRKVGVDNGHDMEPLIAVQREAIRAWMTERGCPIGALAPAIEALERAGEVARYLSTVPV